MKLQETGEPNEELINRTVHQILLGWTNQGGWDGTGDVARMGAMKNAYSLVLKPEGKRLLGRPRSKWKDITVDFSSVGSELDRLRLFRHDHG
jgi:hypothetical protein